MLNFILIAILIILSLLYVVRRTGQQKGKAPPGPKGWPVFQIFLESELPTLHLKLYDWTEKYGDIFQFELLGKKFISLNSSEVLREAFNKEPNATITSFRPPTFTGEYQLDNYADVGFSSPDPLWTKRRKLAYQLLRAYGEGLSIIESQVKENLQSMQNAIRSKENKNVDPSSIVEEFILNTVEILVIGRSFGRKGELQKILKKLDHILNITVNPGYDILYGFLPFLRFLPLPISLKMKEFRKTKQVMMDYLETLSKEETVEKGIYHTLKDIMKQRDEHGNQWFTKENLSNLLVNLVSGGYLTTRGTVMSMIQILAKRPELQKALQREVDDVIGFDREPCLSDRHKCPLTDAVILETLRYISHLPLSVFHGTSQETTIAGYTIEKNTVIIPNVWAMHLSEKEWEEPFTFKPERFLDADGLLLPANGPIRKKFLAFGTGKRNCIGEVFAKSRIFLFLSTLMQQTTIFEPDGKSLSDLRQREMLPGIVLQPQPYEVRFVLRQKLNVGLALGIYVEFLIYCEKQRGSSFYNKSYVLVSSDMLNFILIAILIILSLLYVVRKTSRQRGKALPGPKGWPVFQIFLESELPTLHFKLYDWTEKYGDIFQFEFLGKKFVSLNSSEVLREAFNKEPNATITSFRPPTFTGEYQLGNYADVGFSSPDPLWTKRRNLTYQLLRAYGKGLSIIESQVKENLQSMKKDIQSIENKNVDPSSIVEEFILSTVEILTIGRSFGKKGELQKILKKLDHIINITVNPGYDILYGFLPFLRFLPLPISLKMKEFRKTKQIMMDYLETLSKEETVEKGIYHTLKDIMKQRDEHGNQWFTKENLSNLLVNLVAGGYLTTRGTVMSMIQILAKRPELQKALQREVDDVIGFDREPCLSDRHKCPLTDAVILETLRYISHLPLSVFHATSQETTIAGYTIEKNTVIIPNVWAMHLSEKEWEEPFTFKPERFLDADGLLLPANGPIRKKFLAFGTGKRNCIGEVFAKSRIFLFLSTLMQQTTIFEPDGKSLSDLRQREMLPGIVLQPQPYEVRFALRQK
ncbi:uncharacterized protein LOC125683404 [Ostrea edulis]|uniref:uncharacterized protein LOC125683404 n=1 Tax=Ostrea edulis TaxID=37623 RepID=UPI0024AF061B|nr:uncharacterized protein LOC125683404 [Ostrea edulis]